MVADSFPKRVRERRERLGLTLDEVARRLGITKGAVAHYEQGRANPDYPKLDKLADVLQCDRDWLIYGGDPYAADRLMALTGLIGSGGVVRDAGRDEVLVPKPCELQALTALTAYRVESDSATRPCYVRNDLVYCLPCCTTDCSKACDEPETFGLPAVVRTGGRALFTSNLQPGSRRGLVTLMAGEREAARDVKPDRIELVVMAVHSRSKHLAERHA